MASQLSITAEGVDGHLPDDDTEALSALVGVLYDAALDSALWPSALTLVSCYMESFSSAIYDWGGDGSSRGFIHDDGKLDPDFKSLYFRHYAKLDPVAGAHRGMAVGEPFSAADVLDHDRYLRTRFYREWSQPQQIVDLLAAPIERVGASTVLFGVIRQEREGVADDAMRRRMRLVTPHVRRAMLVSGMQEAAANRNADLGATLDGLSAGLFLLDAEGRIVHANAAAREMIAERRAVLLRDGAIATFDPAATRLLTDAVAAAAGDRAAIGSKGLEVAIAGRDGSRFAAHVLPLGRGAPIDGRGKVAVFIHAAALDTAAGPGLVGSAFELTPAEQRVLGHIVEAGSVAEAAERMRLSEATVKTHLQHIFSKTGTARQAELVRLVAGFAGPLRR